MSSPDSLPSSMRAWTATRLGTPKAALTLQQSQPVPGSPTGSNLLIRVSHAALNPADVFHMSIIPTILPFRRTPIIGLDFSGTVVSTGPDVAASEFSPGTEVCGAMSVGLVATGHGSLAEYVPVPASLVSRIPDGFGLRESAGLGIVSQTAMIAMGEAGGLGKGDRVLVNGASGGLGSMVVQLAKSYGAEVVGVCSGVNEEMVKGFGADETIDYKAHEPLHAYLSQKHAEEQFDFIFDCVGDQVLFEQSPPFLKATGKFICLTGGKSQGVIPYIKNILRPSFLGATPRTYRILGLTPSGDLMRDVVKACNEGGIKQVPVDSEYGFDEVIEAYDRVMSKRSKGKVIIKISG